jgi:hypothetical protein
MFNIQSIFFQMQSFLYYIFDKMALRVKPDEDNSEDDEENILLNHIER